MNSETTLKAIEGLSGVAKTYVRISYLKTALTAIFIGYAALKVFKFFNDN